MSKLLWDQTSEKLYETGVDKGVVYPQDNQGKYGDGVAWNGLTAVNESPEGAEPKALYANNRKYLNLISAEEFKGTIEAFTYPEEFEPCNGVVKVAEGVYVTQQKRTPFGFCYRTGIGNDVLGTKYGYKIHLVYNAVVSPSEKENATINEDPEASTLSWEFATTPVDVEGLEPTAHIIIDSTKVDADKLAELEAMLYGTDGDGDEGTVPKLPLPSEVISLVGAAATEQ